MDPVAVYVLHADDDADRKAAKELTTHLAPLWKIKKEIRLVRDDVSGTATVKEQREAAVDEAEINVVLLTPRFIVGDEYDFALRALERMQRKEARVVAVLVESSDWRETAFGPFRALPVGRWDFISQWPDKASAWVSVVEGLKKVIETVKTTRKQARSGPTPQQVRFQPLPGLPELPDHEPARVLIVTANPVDTVRLRLGEEIRQIKDRLAKTERSRRFDIISEPEVRVDQLSSLLLDRQPHIVHFSGHGEPSSEILMLDPDHAGHQRPVAISALRGLFKELTQPLYAIILDCCYSAANPAQANSLAEVAGCVVGMTGAIKDRAAISYAAGFYEALGFGRSVASAHRLGTNAIQMMGYSQPQEHIPVLHHRSEIDPDRIHLFR